MLKKFVQLFALALSGSLLFSCTPKEEINTPEIKLSSTVFESSSMGGDFYFAYKVLNPVDGATLSVTASDSVVITSIEYDPLATEGEVRFVVSASGVTQARSASLAVAYPGAETVYCSVIQDASEKEPFSIKITDVSAGSVTFDIEAADQNQPYVFLVASSLYLQQNGLDTDEKLIADDIAYFQNIADINDVPLSEVFASFANSGDTTGCVMNGLEPETEYIAYMYGVDIEKCVVTTKLVKEVFTTSGVSTEDVQWDVALSFVSNVVNLDISTEYEGYYSYRIYTKSSVEDAYGNDYQLAFSEDWRYTMLMWVEYGATMDQILELFCYKGNQSLSSEGFKAGVPYILGIYGVDSLSGYVCTNVYTYEFEIEKPEASENQIDISVYNITQNTAEVNISVSNSDPYTIALLSESTVEGMEENDLMEYLYTMFSLTTYNGDQSFKVMDLYSATSYYVVAFGYDAGINTTSLFKTKFTTLEEGGDGIVVDMNIGNYYSVAEVSRLDSYWQIYDYKDALLPFEVTVNPYGAQESIYYGIFTSEQFEGITDNMIKKLIKNGGPKQYRSVAALSFDQSYTAVAVAVDPDGIYGPLYKKEFTLKADGVSDPQEFLDLMEAWNNPNQVIAPMYPKACVKGDSKDLEVKNLKKVKKIVLD
ncbi:MAG: hypothetical protein SPJ99_08360 [Candidatus Coprenecus sp.]|nr:hypothetical protein [Candidatus Coprenecus sp.]